MWILNMDKVLADEGQVIIEEAIVDNVILHFQEIDWF